MMEEFTFWDIKGMDVSLTKEKILNDNPSQDTEIKQIIFLSISELRV